LINSLKKILNETKSQENINKDDFLELKNIMDSLIEEQPLDEKYLEHKLIGDWRGYLECHIKPNWLLIYKIEEALIKFARIGTHQQLFKKY